ncbi:MAG TPA: DUF4912 domain-containing protein [Anaeromyxobacter sp.]|nr:DUF4912 domain-containing protein [Anaeromyxobacter sp.]
MPDLKKMTLESLRELARKKLGPGHSRLKTKGEIIAALEAGEAGEPARPPGARARAASTGEAQPAGKAVRAVKEVAKAARAGVRAAVRAGKGAAEGARAAKGAAGGGKGGRLRKAAAVAAGAAAGAVEAARRPGARPGEGRLDPEGHFVARVRGEEAVREAPHAMAETGADAPWRGEPEGVGGPKYEEGLGDLPWGYGDDAFVALPRDPTSLFLYWDLSHETTARAFEGLDHGRAQLWLFVDAGEGWSRLRTLEFALESRGWYLHDLEPGRTYRAEIHAIDWRGRDRLVRSSNPVRLPPVGPSPIVDDRFVRIPWDMPLGRLLGPGHRGAPFSDEARALLARLSDWGRFQGSSWGAGGMGGRPFSPTSSPGTTPGPQGGGEER